MGYTHYTYFNRTPPAYALAAAVEEMAKLVEDGVRRGVLFGPAGRGAPKIVAPRRDELKRVVGEGGWSVAFNGDATHGNDHETFLFPGDMEIRDLGGRRAAFDFCKTARKPYDAYVVACLLVAREKFDGATLGVASDGGVAEWRDGRDVDSEESGVAVFRRVLGREPPDLEFLDREA